MNVKLFQEAVNEAVTESSERPMAACRALVVAGAEAVVTSLWKVDDRTTSELMEAYYRNLAAVKYDKITSVWEWHIGPGFNTTAPPCSNVDIAVRT